MRLLFLLLFCTSLFGDELFREPPRIWKTECYRCRPIEQCQREIEEGIVVDLRNPVYTDGVLVTDQGGVLTAPGFRVQAQTLTYTQHLECDPPIYTVECSGNILMDYGQWTVVGEYLYYDFITHTGYVINGRTAQPPWYVGGEEVLLLDTGEVMALNAYITTSEGEHPDVVLRSPKITLTPNKVVNAKDLNLWVEKIPLFWFPTMNIDLDNQGRSPFAVKFGWGGFMGSHLSLLYQFLSWNEFKGVARLDGFFGHGLGAGIETRYNPKFKPTEWYTRSYYAHDISIDDREKRDRYRLQGTYYDCIRGTRVNGMYDYVSDPEMAADFSIQDFDLPTAGRTQLELRKQENSWIANVFARVRVNDFQSVNQELPTFAMHWHPFEVPSTGIMVENTFRAGYLDYVFSEDVDNAIDFHSARVATYPRLYRPFFFGPFTATPEAGFIGIGYTNSPGGGSVGQAIGELGFRFDTALSKCYSSVKHVLEPYTHYRYLTQPRVSTDRHYIFTIDDGYDRLNLLRVGCENSFFTHAPCGIARPLWIDLWTNIFFNEKTIPQAVPKGYLKVDWEPTPYLFTQFHGAWNFRHGLADFYNARIDWTLSEDLAFGLEYRHRSRYDWRKGDFYNFILETVRTEAELLASPLSDQRDTFLFRTFLRLTPEWDAKFDLRHGTRRTQPSFLEYQLEVSTIFFSHWRFAFIYEKREADNRYSASLKLAPGPPPKRRACL